MSVPPPSNSDNQNNSDVTGLSGSELLGDINDGGAVPPQQQVKQNELFAQFIEQMKSHSDEKNHGRDSSIDISKDHFSAFLVRSGIAPFDLAKYAEKQLNEKLGDLKPQIINYVCGRDSTIKPAEALKAAKIDLGIPSLMALLCLILGIDTVRKNMAQGASAETQFCILAGLSMDIMKSQMCWDNKEQIAIAQLFGQMVEHGSHLDVRRKYLECVGRATFGKRMKSGFDHSSGGVIRNVKGGKKKTTNNKFKRRNYRDPSDPEHVPKGYCVWFVRRGGCKKGEDCEYIHASPPKK